MRKLTQGQSSFLNAARYLAAAMVLLYHGLHFFFNRLGIGERTQVYYSQLGFVGVSIFFILSGFVIAYTVSRKMSEEAEYTIRTYLIERFSRISIVFVPALCTVALIDLLLVRGAFSKLDVNLWPYFFSTLFMLTGFTGFGPQASPLPTILGMDPVWSLTYEVYLYVVFGVIVLYPRSSRHRIAKLAGLAAALFLLSRLPHALLMSFTWLLGALGARLFQRGVALSRSACAVLLGGLALAAAGFTAFAGQQPESSKHWVFVSLLAAAFFVLVTVAGTVRVGPRLAAAARVLASYSYSMYLLHYMLLGVASNIVFDVRAIAARGSAVTALFLAALLAAVNVICYFFSLTTERHTAWLKGLLLNAANRGTDRGMTLR